MQEPVRRLSETDMPIGVISAHSRRDQNVKKGHLHTLHVVGYPPSGRLPGGADGDAASRPRR